MGSGKVAELLERLCRNRALPEQVMGTVPTPALQEQPQADVRGKLSPRTGRIWRSRASKFVPNKDWHAGSSLGAVEPEVPVAPHGEVKLQLGLEGSQAQRSSHPASARVGACPKHQDPGFWGKIRLLELFTFPKRIPRHPVPPRPEGPQMTKGMGCPWGHEQFEEPPGAAL